MAYTKYKADSDAARMHRQAVGKQLREWREQCDLTQRELSQKLGLNYYTFISQVETGSARVPPESMVAWAKALDQDLVEFAKVLLSHYDPHMFSALFRGGK
tara:strand:- start:158 stop:460 length:303 start_codon:yes stop_codon:yes gene_type:complete